LTPKLVGNSVGLHPVWLIFALSVFGSLFGFVGMLVAVPVTAMIGVVARFLIQQYKAGLLYRGLSPRERDAFFVSEANRQAVAQLENTAIWPQGKLILLGPKACGKTHLLAIWATEQNAQKIDPLREFVPPEAGARVVVDNLEQVAGILPAETRLFHLHNQLQSSGGLLLMASSIAMRQAGFQLADLLSRLEGTNCAKIDRPDDALLHAVLLKSFMDRQLSPTPAVLAYVILSLNWTVRACPPSAQSPALWPPR